MPTGQRPAGAFGLEAFTQDDRLRLFSFTNAGKSTLYVWTLRAFEHARANYPLVLHVGDVASALLDLADEFLGQVEVTCRTADELTSA